MDTRIVSGPGRQLAALASACREHGVEIRIYMFQRVRQAVSPFTAYLERAGIEHIVLPDAGPLDLSLLSSLGRALHEWTPDLVQSHGYRPTVLVYLNRVVGANRPWIAFNHGTTNENWKVRLYHRIDRALMPKADRLVVMSEKHFRDFAWMGDRVRVIHNASILQPAEVTSTLSLPARRTDVPLVGVLARLSYEKGVDLLLQAAARRRVAGFPFSLIVAGDGPERGPLEKLAVALGIADDVRFLGTVDSVAPLYAQLDLVVLPSRSEGLPNVLLEALQADVPIVATAVGAVPEVLADPVAGEMVPAEDVSALAEAIGRALTTGRHPAARAARAAAAKRFSLAHRVACHLNLYAELCPDRLVTTDRVASPVAVETGSLVR